MKEVDENRMDRLLEKALMVTSESRHIEYKSRFDPSSTAAWCEIVKDIVAIANSGGGVIVFGLDDKGIPTGDPVDQILKIDPADSTNRVFRYTGTNLEYEIRPASKLGHPLAVFMINGIDTPLVFHKPGAYKDGSGNSGTAFHMGTIYFRHGAKSEPGNTEDLRRVIDRRLESRRREWIRGVRKVVKAPPNSQIVALPVSGKKGPPPNLASVVRPVDDPTAMPVILTRDPNKPGGTFVHEEVSEGLLKGINNVIDLNRLLAAGKRRFSLGQPVYFRVYAERHHAVLTDEEAELLLDAAVTQFYAPSLYWMLMLSDKIISQHFKDWFSHPQQPQCYGMVRIAALLGKDFSIWLWEQYHKAWENHPQPPGFHWTLKEVPKKLEYSDPRVVASRHSTSSHVAVAGEAPITVGALLQSPEKAASLLSIVCMQIFDGDNSGDLRDTARTLDYIAYGTELIQRSEKLAREIIGTIGDQSPTMPQETPTEEKA